MTTTNTTVTTVALASISPDGDQGEVVDFPSPRHAWMHLLDERIAAEDEHWTWTPRANMTPGSINYSPVVTALRARVRDTEWEALAMSGHDGSGQVVGYDPANPSANVTYAVTVATR